MSRRTKWNGGPAAKGRLDLDLLFPPRGLVPRAVNSLLFITDNCTV